MKCSDKMSAQDSFFSASVLTFTSNDHMLHTILICFGLTLCLVGQYNTNSIICCRDTDDASVHFSRSLFSWWLVAVEGGVFFASLLLTVFIYNVITMGTVS